MGCAASLGIAPHQDQNQDQDQDITDLIQKSPTHIDSICTKTQKAMVRKTWAYLSTKDTTERGVRVFLRIFMLKPELKQLFPFKEKDGDELTSDVTFRGHASRFMQTVGATIENLDGLDIEMGPLLRSLGKQHIAHDGVSDMYFKYFVVAMSNVLMEDLGRKFTPDVQTAWLNVLEYIVLNLSRGFRAADKHKSSQKKKKNRIHVDKHNVESDI